MSSVVLQLKALGVGDVLSFDYMDKPPLTSVKRSVELLRVLGALDSKGHLTSLGTKIATLPLDPMLAKTLLISEEFGCSSEVLSIVSLLSSESIFFYPKGGREKAEAIRKRFFSMEGDHLTLLNVYKAYAALTGQRHQWCRDNFINFRSIKHATEVRKQLEGYCLQLGIQLVSCGDETECIRKSITSGFFLHAAIRQEDGEYKTCVGNKIVHLHPSSVLFGKKPGCVIYNQLVFTKRNYMRDVVMVQPQWLTELSNSFYGGQASSPSSWNRNRREIDRCNVFVKYLPSDFRDGELRELFSQCGKVVSCKVMVDHQSQGSLGYGFVRFSCAEEARMAIKTMTGHHVQNKTLLCKLSNSSVSLQSPSTNLYVKPLPSQMNEEQLKEMFSKFGKIVECKVMVDKKTGKSKQIGFVRFTNVEDASAALREMNGSKLTADDPILVVKYAETDTQKAARKARKLASQHASAVREATSHLLYRGPELPTQTVIPMCSTMPLPYYPAHNLPTGVLPGGPPHHSGLPAMSGPPHSAYEIPHYGGVAYQHVAAYAPPSPLHSPPTPMSIVHYSPPHAPTPIINGMVITPSQTPTFPQTSQSPLPSLGYNLFVFHLPSDVDDVALEHLFSPFGQMESVKVIKDKKTGESKGYGFVKYIRMEDAINAITCMNGYRVGNKHLKVSFKTGPPPGASSTSPTPYPAFMTDGTLKS
ncbi:putative ATP-dependent RNA helicase dhx33 [Balamuthia mandrillaris]